MGSHPRGRDAQRVHLLVQQPANAHGARAFKGAFEEGTVRLNLVFVGDQGSVERVNTVATISGGDFSVEERGTCTVSPEG